MRTQRARALKFDVQRDLYSFIYSSKNESYNLITSYIRALKVLQVFLMYPSVIKCTPDMNDILVQGHSCHVTFVAVPLLYKCLDAVAHWIAIWGVQGPDALLGKFALPDRFSLEGLGRCNVLLDDDTMCWVLLLRPSTHDNTVFSSTLRYSFALSRKP